MESLAEATGIPVSALKLGGSLFAGYPLALAHRYLFWGKSESVQNLFFAATGMGLVGLSFGKDLIHSVICTFAQWTILQTMGHSKYGLYVSFLFQFGYLLGGYYYTMTEDYDICWTMPGCVMCLRLIGLAFDRYDGSKAKEKRRPDQLERCLEESPSLLEIFGFSYSFVGVMIGPQYPLAHYRRLLRGELTDKTGEPPQSLSAGFKIGALGTGLLAFSEIFKGIFPGEYMASEKFLTQDHLIQRLGYISATGMVLMYKYISSWTIVNGAAMITGMGYTKSEDGTSRWNALENVKLSNYWTAKSYDEMIKAFNVNTNDWVARYIFKRCRWMGSRYASHFTTLMFLAIWHGYHLAYFVMFAIEFAVVNGEKQIFLFTSKLDFVQKLHPRLRDALGYIYVSVTWGFCVIEFSLLKKEAYMPVWKSIYYINWIFWGFCWLGLGYINTKMAAPVKSEKKTE